MWKVDKVKQYKGNFGYVYLTRLNDEGEELSEKLMLPIMVLDGYDWDNPVSQISDDSVSMFLCDILETLGPEDEDELYDENEDEITDMVYVKTHVVPAAE